MTGEDFNLLVWVVFGMFISFFSAIGMAAMISELDERESIWMKCLLWVSLIPFTAAFIFFSIILFSGIVKWTQG